jgi:hypothetical protein
LPESGAAPTGARVDGDQLRLRRRDENSLPADCVSRRGRIEPPGHAAACEVAVGDVALDLRIEHPPLAAARWIESNDASERGADVHRPVNDQRRCFKRGGLLRRKARFGFAGAICPRKLEPSDVFACDFGAGEVARARDVAAVSEPADLLGTE